MPSQRPALGDRATRESVLGTDRRKGALDQPLVRILHTLLTQCSVSRTAALLGQSQPAISVALGRLRTLIGDPLLVRSGSRMVPTSRGLSLIEPSARVLFEFDRILHLPLAFDALTTTQVFSIGTPDYLDVFFVPAIVERVARAAPNARLDFKHLLSGDGYERGLEDGGLDVVIGNWQTPPERLHLQPLCDDDLVCLMRRRHPVAPGRLTSDAYAAADHLAVVAQSTVGLGTIDIELSLRGLARRVTTTLPYFSMAPYVLVKSNLIFTTTRSFAQHYAQLLALRIEPLPVQGRALRYYQLWHERSHHDPAMRWLRSLVADAAKSLVPAA